MTWFTIASRLRLGTWRHGSGRSIPIRERQPYASLVHRDMFNGDFYLVAGTVIPVLFLALTLQGQTFDRLTESLRESSRKAIRKDLQEQSGFGAGFRMFVIATVIFIIVVAGLAGEFMAMIALYTRSLDKSLEVTVLVCLLVLVLAVVSVLFVKYEIAVIGPFIEILKPLFAAAFDTAATMARPAVEYASKVVTDDARKATEGKDRAPESADADQIDKKSLQEGS